MNDSFKDRLERAYDKMAKSEPNLKGLDWTGFKVARWAASFTLSEAEKEAREFKDFNQLKGDDAQELTALRIADRLKGMRESLNA